MLKLYKMDLIFTAPLYILTMLTEAAFMYVVWMTDYRLGGGGIFQAFYTLTSGASIALCAVLVYRSFGKSRYNNQVTLLLSAIVQAADLAVDTIYVCLYDGMWGDGYLYFVIELVWICCYLRRYFFLNEMHETFGDGPGQGAREGAKK